MIDEFVIFAGTANAELAASVARELGVQLGACAIERFPDGETSVRLDEPVRGREVFIVQPTSPPVNDHLVELLAFADSCRRASAAQITAIVPYFGYARSDKRDGERVPVMASMVAGLMQSVGINHVVTVDVHTPQLEGFFRIPVDSLTAVPVLADAVGGRLPEGTVVVSPDAGRVKMATQFAQRLKTSVVMLHKRRESGTETKVTHLVGDVRDRACLIIDDMISTGGTMVDAAQELRARGATAVYACATHAVFAREALAALIRAPVERWVVTNTVPLPAEEGAGALRVLSVAPLLAESIYRIHDNLSVSGLFD